MVPEPAAFGSFLYTDMWNQPCSVLARTKGNHGFSFVGHGPADVGARTSRTREVPIHGYAEPSLLPSLLDLKEIVAFQSAAIAPRTLAPAPAAFRGFLHTDYVEPFSFHPYPNCRNSLFSINQAAPRPSGARTSHHRVTLTHGFVEPSLLQAYPNDRKALFFSRR